MYHIVDVKSSDYFSTNFQLGFSISAINGDKVYIKFIDFDHTNGDQLKKSREFSNYIDGDIILTLASAIQTARAQDLADRQKNHIDDINKLNVNIEKLNENLANLANAKFKLVQVEVDDGK